jgi:hypothetical protein
MQIRNAKAKNESDQKCMACEYSRVSLKEVSCSTCGHPWPQHFVSLPYAIKRLQDNASAVFAFDFWWNVAGTSLLVELPVELQGIVQDYTRVSFELHKSCFYNAFYGEVDYGYHLVFSCDDWSLSLTHYIREGEKEWRWWSSQLQKLSDLADLVDENNSVDADVEWDQLEGHKWTLPLTVSIDMGYFVHKCLTRVIDKCPKATIRWIS